MLPLLALKCHIDSKLYNKHVKHPYHPENGSAGLFYLLRASPSSLHCSQAKVTNFNSPALMEKNIWQQISEKYNRQLLDVFIVSFTP